MGKTLIIYFCSLHLEIVNVKQCGTIKAVELFLVEAGWFSGRKRQLAR